jgi:hypothetical protein
LYKVAASTVNESELEHAADLLRGQEPHVWVDWGDGGAMARVDDASIAGLIPTTLVCNPLQKKVCVMRRCVFNTGFLK